MKDDNNVADLQKLMFDQIKAKRAGCRPGKRNQTQPGYFSSWYRNHQCRKSSDRRCEGRIPDKEKR